MVAANRECFVFFWKRHVDQPNRNILNTVIDRRTRQETSLTSWVRDYLLVTMFVIFLPTNRMLVAVATPRDGAVMEMDAGVTEGLPMKSRITSRLFRWLGER